MKKLEETILRLCRTAHGKTICPIEAAYVHAEVMGEDQLAWRHWLQKVRDCSVALANEGRLIIYRKGKPADPNEFRGVYRLGLPWSD